MRSSIYDEPSIGSRAIFVYQYLEKRANKDGECWPGIKRIANDLKLSRSTVKRALNDLYRAGFLEREERYRDNGSSTSNLYRVK